MFDQMFCFSMYNERKIQPLIELPYSQILQYNPLKIITTNGAV